MVERSSVKRSFIGFLELYVNCSIDWYGGLRPAYFSSLLPSVPSLFWRCVLFKLPTGSLTFSPCLCFDGSAFCFSLFL